MTEETKFKFPWFTTSITLLSLGLYLVFLYMSQDIGRTSELYSTLGAPTAHEIYEGQFWGVIWNSFLHENWYHLLINLTGLWLFGAYLERRIHFYNLFLLGFFASVITSIWQLALSNDAGIGLSGVNFFLFSYIIGKSNVNKAFKLNFRYIYFSLIVITLVLCYKKIIATDFNIGVEAMSAGLFFGYVTGWASEFKRKKITYSFAILLLMISAFTMFYAPWSYEWHLTQGVKSHFAGDIAKARFHYKKTLKLDPGNETAAENLVLLKIDDLSLLAETAHKNGEYERAAYYYEEILKLSPNDYWARQNLNKLP